MHFRTFKRSSEKFKLIRGHIRILSAQQSFRHQEIIKKYQNIKESRKSLKLNTDVFEEKFEINLRH